MKISSLNNIIKNNSIALVIISSYERSYLWHDISLYWNRYNKKVKINTMDKLLISIFRSAIYEILFSDNVTKKIVISEYLLIANRFFGNNETALINGVLDNLQNS